MLGTSISVDGRNTDSVLSVELTSLCETSVPFGVSVLKKGWAKTHHRNTENAEASQSISNQGTTQFPGLHKPGDEVYSSSSSFLTFATVSSAPFDFRSLTTAA